jgi:ketosteroid isomerase-like protein
VGTENVEAVREIFAAWARGDFSSIGWADPEIRFRGADATEGRGHEEMVRWWADWLHSTAEFRVEALELFDGGEQVVSFNHFSGTGRSSGVPFEDMAGACRFALRNGKVVELQLYTDRNEALRDAGIDPATGSG